MIVERLMGENEALIGALREAIAIAECSLEDGGDEIEADTRVMRQFDLDNIKRLLPPDTTTPTESPTQPASTPNHGERSEADEQ